MYLVNSYWLKATVEKTQLAYSRLKLIGCIFKCFSENSFLKIQDLPKAGQSGKPTCSGVEDSGFQMPAEWPREIPLPVRTPLRLPLMTGISKNARNWLKHDWGAHLVINWQKEPGRCLASPFSTSPSFSLPLCPQRALVDSSSKKQHSSNPASGRVNLAPGHFC